MKSEYWQHWQSLNNLFIFRRAMHFAKLGILLLLIIVLDGCKTGIQEYQQPIEIPKNVERIGPSIDVPEAKPFQLEMPKEKIPVPERKTFELTERDLFAEKEWNPLKVSVFNITLGDSMDLVLSALGKPDEVIPHPTMDIVNIGYGPSIGLNKTALVFYFMNKTLNRITIKENFNPYLHGQTIINYSKKDIYERFGIPDSQKDLPKFRMFSYPSKGLEIIHSGNKMKAFVVTYGNVTDSDVTSAAQDTED